MGHMEYILWLIVALVVVSIGFQVLFLRFYARIVNEGLHRLDLRLAEALTSVIENIPETLIGQIDPPNPFQQLITQYMAQKMNPTLQVKDITRDENGQFTQDTSLNTE
tara:strand:+ start:2596 stop:2919 length:324 start_codon:yes stop_codon:yes gene_type:complete